MSKIMNAFAMMLSYSNMGCNDDMNANCEIYNALKKSMNA